MNHQQPTSGMQRGILSHAPQAAARRKPPKPQQHQHAKRPHQHKFHTQMSTPLTTSGSTTPHSDRTMSPALLRVLPMAAQQHGVSLSASPLRHDPMAHTRRVFVPVVDYPRERTLSFQDFMRLNIPLFARVNDFVQPSSVSVIFFSKRFTVTQSYPPITVDAQSSFRRSIDAIDISSA